MRSILMKILLKKEVCRSREQYTGPTRKALYLLKRASQKKKKKKWNAKRRHWGLKAVSKQVLKLIWIRSLNIIRIL